MSDTTRYTADILDNVFTYTEDLVSLAMRRTRPELLADARELKYAGTSRLNKRDLAIMLVDAHLAELDAVEAKKTAEAIAECDRVDAAPKYHECGSRVTLSATRQHGEVLGHTFREDGVLLAHVQLKNGVVRVLPELDFHAMTSHEMRFAMDMPAGELRTVTQGHADYCARNGHAIHTLDGKITSLCPRCGERSVTFHPNKDNHAFVPFGKSFKCIGDHTGWIDAKSCAEEAHELILTNARKAVTRRDTIDQGQMVDVMIQVVDNGREDLIPVLDMIDAAQCPAPNGRHSTIPRGEHCHRCAESASPCDECVLAWLRSIFNITGDVKLYASPFRHAVEFDCNA